MNTLDKDEADKGKTDELADISYVESADFEAASKQEIDAIFLQTS